MIFYLLNNIYFTYSIALVLLIFCFIIFRFIEGLWFPPASIFFLGYISATFLYSLSIIVFDVSSPSIQYDNMSISIVYSLFSFLFLIIGYSLFFVLFNKKVNTNAKIVTILKPIFTERSLNAALILLFSLLLINLINHPLLSIRESARGDNSYINDSDVTIWYRVTFIASQLLIPYSIAILISSYSMNKPFAIKARKYSLYALVVTIMMTLFSFDRHAAVSSVLLMMIFFHFRISPVKLKTIFFSFFLLIILQLVRLFRDIGSYVDISYIQMLEIFKNANLSLVLVGPFTAIGGWDVFTNVFDLVPSQEAYKYGMTYINSLLGLLSPRALGLGSYEVYTPSRWYMELYAPGTTNHGYDFSLLAETYINFGYWGPVFFIPIGFFISFLSNNIRFSKSSSKLFFSLIALESITFGMRMDSNAIFKAMFFKVLPVLVIGFVFRRLFDKARC